MELQITANQHYNTVNSFDLTAHHGDVIGDGDLIKSFFEA